MFLGVLLTTGAQQVAGKLLPQSQLEFCHLYHQTDMREPNRHQSELLRQLNEQDVRVQVELVSPSQQIPNN